MVVKSLPVIPVTALDRGVMPWRYRPEKPVSDVSREQTAGTYLTSNCHLTPGFIGVSYFCSLHFCFWEGAFDVYPGAL